MTGIRSYQSSCPRGVAASATKGSLVTCVLTGLVFEDVRGECGALTRSELDMVLMGQIMAHICDGEKIGARSNKTRVQRKRNFTTRAGPFARSHS